MAFTTFGILTVTAKPYRQDLRARLALFHHTIGI